MNWQDILLGEANFKFLWEISLRSLIMFVLLFAGLRITGKRGIKQLSVFELLLIIALGSAAGDPMLYKEVGVLSALIVFGVVFVLYKIITNLIIRSERIEEILEGKPFYIMRNGKASQESLQHKELAVDEFFAALRNRHFFHLGQIKYAVLETNGEISVLPYDQENIRPGLPIWPHLYGYKTTYIPLEGIYSCTYCGNTEHKLPGKGGTCSYCLKNDQWIKSCIENTYIED